MNGWRSRERIVYYENGNVFFRCDVWVVFTGVLTVCVIVRGKLTGEIDWCRRGRGKTFGNF